MDGKTYPHIYISDGSNTTLLDDYPPHLIPEAIKAHQNNLAKYERALGYWRSILGARNDMIAQGNHNPDPKLRARFPAFTTVEAAENTIDSIQWHIRHETALAGYFVALAQREKLEVM